MVYMNTTQFNFQRSHRPLTRWKNTVVAKNEEPDSATPGAEQVSEVAEPGPDTPGNRACRLILWQHCPGLGTMVLAGSALHCLLISKTFIFHLSPS